MPLLPDDYGGIKLNFDTLLNSLVARVVYEMILRLEQILNENYIY